MKRSSNQLENRCDGRVKKLGKKQIPCILRERERETSLEKYVSMTRKVCVKICTLQIDIERVEKRVKIKEQSSKMRQEKWAEEREIRGRK